MLTFKHRIGIKCQTSLQGLNSAKCKVFWAPTDFNQAPASTSEMKLSLQLSLSMKGQVGLQVFTMALLQSPPEPKGKTLGDFNSIWIKPPSFVPYWNLLWNSNPSWFAAGTEVLGCILFIFLWVEGGEPSINHTAWLFSRTCFHSIVVLTNCNTLGRNFPLQIFALGGLILGKDQAEQFSFFSQTSIRDRGALLSVSRSLPTSSLRNAITSHQWPKTLEAAVFATLQNKPPVVRKATSSRGAAPAGRWGHAEPTALPRSAGIWLLTDRVCIKDIPAGTTAKDNMLFVKAALQQEG